MDNDKLSVEQWRNIAEKVAKYFDRMCSYILNAEYNCGNCPFIEECDGKVMQTYVIEKAKKELGYE